VFPNLLGAAEGALIRAAASTQPFGRFLEMFLGGRTFWEAVALGLER
jgi:hypothetical protein